MDPETGRVLQTISTGKSDKTRAAEWTLSYLRGARERLQREVEEAKNRSALESQITVADIADGFWDINAPYARGRRARGYSISYGYLEASESYARNHIIPEWGDRPVTSITSGQIDTWILDLFQRGAIAGATVNKLLQTLRILLDSAVRDGYLSFNPAPPVKPGKPAVLTDRQRQFAESYARDRHKLSNAEWADDSL